jgi:protein required for attachment to host cells
MDAIWVIVANQAAARIYAASRRGEVTSMLEEFLHEAGKAHVRDLVSDGPGRVHDRQGSARHSMESDVGRQEDSIRRFAGRIIDHVTIAAGRDAFRDLVIVAAPAFLGEIRKHVPPHLAERIILEIPKDVIDATADKLTALLNQEL